ncbi:AI-2E family transporter [Microbacterium excoecariae]|uniref:AI-2E family transporter n=1 Tax=Microbacterium excoecariae TaxID=2715210 RepID=UPI001407475E|nr:AI-2E family transporter [Microbacterium excoecariae]NHI16672.1 AI-2E family transporter [Microbacterium excoecariae]
MSVNARRRGPFGRRTAPQRDPARIEETVTDTVPRGLQIAAAYGWRLLVLAGVVALIVWLVIEFTLIVVPVLIAVLLAALLWPGFSWMLRRRVPRAVAIVVSLVTTLGLITGLVWLVVWQVREQAEEVQARGAERWAQFQDWVLQTGILPADQVEEILGFAADFLREQSHVLLTGAWSVGTTVGHVAAGALLAAFTLVCLLTDGEGIWRWTVRLFPSRARDAVDAAARNGWATLMNYARTQIFVASIDGLGIGLGAALLGVPLAIPIGVVVFLASFVPFVGAIVSGALAVVIALVYNGPIIAIAMLAVVLAVQQLESHVLQPLIMGAAVRVHPLAVVLVVMAGSMAGGIAGALFAVPLAAFVNVVAVTLSSRSWHTGDLPEQDLIWRTEPKKIGRGEEENA